MIVVADTSPVNYLAQLNATHLLKDLFGRLVLADAVLTELQQPGAPEAVRAWTSPLPNWVEVRKAAARFLPELQVLGPGESAALELALEMKADLLLIDERKASRIAEQDFGFQSDWYLRCPS